MAYFELPLGFVLNSMPQLSKQLPFSVLSPSDPYVVRFQALSDGSTLVEVGFPSDNWRIS